MNISNIIIENLSKETNHCIINSTRMIEEINNINIQVWKYNQYFIWANIIFYIMMIIDTRIMKKHRENKYHFLWWWWISALEGIMLVWSLTVAVTLLGLNPWRIF